MFKEEINNKIIHQFVKGEERAFQTIYLENIVVLRYFASKYINDEDIIEDLVQETFIKLWEARKGFTDYCAIRTFLYRVLRNSCLNHIRHCSVKRKYEEYLQHNEKYDSFLEQIIESETFDMLFKTFEELSPACRNVYKLSLDGKKHEEIADLLNISINTIKKHKNNANNYMRKRLKSLLSIFLILTIVLFYI